jgi:hypothetical protein
MADQIGKGHERQIMTQSSLNAHNFKGLPSGKDDLRLIAIRRKTVTETERRCNRGISRNRAVGREMT